MKKRIYFYINGIMNKPENATGWTDRATTWTHVNRSDDFCFAEKLEYFVDPFFRRRKQQKLAQKFAKRISFYESDEWDIYLVGHSNGCDIILRILKLLDNNQIIKEIHLVSPACCSDFEKNGILDYIRLEKVGKVKVYIAGSDKAMKVATLSSKLFGFIGLGYGDMGGMNPNHLRTIIGQRNVIYEKDYGHSTWFMEDNGNFDSFMGKVTTS